MILSYSLEPKSTAIAFEYFVYLKYRIWRFKKKNYIKVIACFKLTISNYATYFILTIHKILLSFDIQYWQGHVTIVTSFPKIFSFYSLFGIFRVLAWMCLYSTVNISILYKNNAVKMEKGLRSQSICILYTSVFHINKHLQLFIISIVCLVE